MEVYSAHLNEQKAGYLSHAQIEAPGKQGEKEVKIDGKEWRGEDSLSHFNICLKLIQKFSLLKYRSYPKSTYLHLLYI